MINIAIDGYSGAGKSTLTKLLAKKLGNDFKVLDTGAIFRAMACGFIDFQKSNNIDDNSVNNFLNKNTVNVKFVDGIQHVYINNKDVTPYIRQENIGILSAKLCVYPQIRQCYLSIAQKFARKNNCIMEGRDIATVVMPNADVKIFLQADENTRAKRRLLELLDKGENTTLEDVIDNLNKRDGLFNKGVTQLKPTHDSIIVDNTNMTLEQTADFCYKIIQKKLNDKKIL